MKKYPSHLILLKGEYKTEEVSSFKYEKGRPFVIVTFRNGSTFKYSSSHFAVFKGAETVLLDGKALLLDDSLRMDAYGVQKFGAYTRVMFTDGSYRTVHSKRIRIADRAVCKSRDGFQYLCEIAEKIGLMVEGRNILKLNYDKVKEIRGNSVLRDYLEQRPVQIKEKIDRTIIYPFGFNLSQKEAVENAMKGKVSLIEGPPGTGKTQTILNILANAVMNDETVAVVSNNNTATENVFEKLQKYDLSFLAAQLGNSENRERFISNQQLAIPKISDWKMERESYNKLEKELAASENELNRMLESKNRLSVLTAEMDDLKREYRHYADGNIQSVKNADDLFTGTASAQVVLELLTEYEYCKENGISIGFFKKLFWRFSYHIRSFNFLKEDLETLAEQFEHLYYKKRLLELEEEITSLQKKLETYEFEQKMQQYTEKSMQLFQAKLAIRYAKGTHGRAYGALDLKTKSDEFTADYPVILSTTYSLIASLGAEYQYDYVIIDEASQVDIATGALAFSCAKKAVIVGDLKQLPNVVDGETRRKVDAIFAEYALPDAYCYAVHSLLSSAAEVFPDAPRVLLREHYRCHPEIIGFCNKRFYNNELIIMTKSQGERPLAVYRTAPGNHARNHLNERQMDVIEKEVLPSIRLATGEKLGIVTPYRSQADALRQRFDEKNDNIKSDTVDKFQGQERTAMIFSTVDNEIGDFVSDPNRLNVAVSRAIREFIVVTDGNDNDKTSPIHDLIGYIKYHNYEVVDSEIRSVFDYLYKGYEQARETVLKKYGSLSEYDSENLMYGVIQEVLAKDEFSQYDVAMHVPLRHLLSNVSKLSDEERIFALSRGSHVDFVIFSKMDYQPVLAVEVDGYAYHAASEKQQVRDKKKDDILEKYGISLERFATTGSGEMQRFEAALRELC